MNQREGVEPDVLEKSPATSDETLELWLRGLEGVSTWLETGESESIRSLGGLPPVEFRRRHVARTRDGS